MKPVEFVLKKEQGLKEAIFSECLILRNHGYIKK
jgi:hypothetical protein